MLLVLSPAKALDYDSPLPALSGQVLTEPAHLDEAQALVECLREKTPAELAQLMSLSDALASLNAARYASWSRPFNADNARPALWAFDGDVYDGLGARTLAPPALAWLGSHLRILSGLYGVLRPFDLMQAYRLEMGTRLPNPRGRDLYAWWGERIARTLRQVLEDEADGVLVNLASEEYFKAVRLDALAARAVVVPVFEDWKGGRYKIVSFYAKRARGLMTRYAASHALTDVEGLKAFAEDGYAFAPEASDARRWVFRRRTD